MMEYPIWVWVAGVIGTIAAGIGLGYLIIFLFWKIEKYFSPPVIIREESQPEDEPEEEPEEVIEEPADEEEKIEIMEQEEEKVPATTTVVLPNERNRMIKFATVLRSSFNSPFQKTSRIVCWDITLENGEEVRDSEGNIMTFRVIQPQGEGERAQYVLTDEAGEPGIPVINGKEYISAETKIDLSKI